jgi:DNA ligase-associated metallophosphoesterase
MIKILETEIRGEKLQLHGQKALFWPSESILMIADVHLGKSKHFRKNGIAVPKDILRVNLERIDTLLRDFNPKRVIFMGDLFHSTYNEVWENVEDYIRYHDSVNFELIMGNHDILGEKIYANSGLIIHEVSLSLDPFLLSHDKIDALEGPYNIYGHIHPCIYLSGIGGQRLRLPCFFFGADHAILPAFGGFTGMHKIPVAADDQVFAVAEQKVMSVVG